MLTSVPFAAVGAIWMLWAFDFIPDFLAKGTCDRDRAQRAPRLLPTTHPIAELGEAAADEACR